MGQRLEFVHMLPDLHSIDTAHRSLRGCSVSSECNIWLTTWKFINKDSGPYFFIWQYNHNPTLIEPYEHCSPVRDTQYLSSLNAWKQSIRKLRKKRNKTLIVLTFIYDIQGSVSGNDKLNWIMIARCWSKVIALKKCYMLCVWPTSH